ncbi:hypothetical protein ACN47E_003087 [Coniothyrium glycines]
MTKCFSGSHIYTCSINISKSPFFDPSLGTANVSTTQVDELDASQVKLFEAGHKLQQFVTGNEHFASQGIFGKTWVNSVLWGM